MMMKGVSYVAAMVALGASVEGVGVDEANTLITSMLPSLNAQLSANILNEDKDPWAYPGGTETLPFSVTDPIAIDINFLVDSISGLSGIQVDDLTVSTIGDADANTGVMTADFALALAFTKVVEGSAKGDLTLGTTTVDFTASMVPTDITAAGTGTLGFTYIAADGDKEADLCIHSLTLTQVTADVGSLEQTKIVLDPSNPLAGFLQGQVDGQVQALSSTLLDGGLTDQVSEFATDLSSDFFASLLESPYCASTTLSPTSSPTMIEIDESEIGGSASVGVSVMVAMIPAALAYMLKA